nr:DUF2314 domain-containing protein [Cerasicoccus arenae]
MNFIYPARPITRWLIGSNSKREEVSDWMYLQDGHLRGGYTIAALIYGTPDQEGVTKSMGIDWSKYKFLKDVN